MSRKEETDQDDIDIREIKANPNIIVNKYINNTWNSNGSDNVWFGRILSFNSRTNMFEVLLLNWWKSSCLHIVLMQCT